MNEDTRRPIIQALLILADILLIESQLLVDYEDR